MTVTVNGVTSNNLTSATDFVDVTGTGVDTVYGEIAVGFSTLTTGDVITGNGKTILRGILGNPVGSPVFELIDINKLDMISTVAGKTVLNGANWQDVHIVKLSSFVDGGSLSVTSFDVADKVRFAVDSKFNSNLIAKGAIGDINYVVDIENRHADADDKGASVRITDAHDVIIKAGAGDDASVTFSQVSTVATADVTVGDFAIGNIRLIHGGYDSGGDGNFDLDITHKAYVSAGGGNATVGNTTIGDISLDYGGDGFNPEFTITVSASVVGAGDAIAGDMTVGDLTIKQAKDFETNTGYFLHYAHADTGNATVGDFTIGNITVMGATGAQYPNYFFITRTASAASGTAKVGNTTVGDITFTVGPNSGGDEEFSISAYAGASQGDAIVGDYTVGDITIIGADSTNSSPSLSWAFTNYALGAVGVAATDGDATVGDMVIGNVSITGGTNFKIQSIDFYNWATVAHSDGVATVGRTTVGDVSFVGGRSSEFDFLVSVQGKQEVTTKQFYGGSHVGKVTIGDVSIKGAFAADIEYSNIVKAEHGRVDGFSIGDMNVTVADSGYVSIANSIEGSSIGAVKFGDLHLDLGFEVQLNRYIAKATATGTASKTGNISSFTVGDIDVRIADQATAITLTFSGIAAHNIGKVEFGNISLAAEAYGTNTANLKFSAANKLGGFSIGDVKLTGNDGENNSATLTINLDGGGGVGLRSGITVGDIVQVFRGQAEGAFKLDVSSSKGNVGDITVGDVLLKGISHSGTTSGASASATVYMHGVDTAGQTGGSMTIGDVSLISRGVYQTNNFTAKITGLATAGDITIGDIRMVGENTGALAQAVTNDVDILLKTDGNNDINIGDVLVRAIDNGKDLTAAQLIYGSITISATQGMHDVNIGDIKVVGGFENTTGAIVDDYNTLSSLLNITTTGKITIGNVDYSRYVNDATIGETAHSWHGMGVIKAAQGDTTIYDTGEQNKIIFGTGDDTIYFDDAQTFGYDDATKIDTVVNFTHTHDTLDLTDIAGSTFKRAGSFATYEDFVTAAKASVVADTDVFMAIVGSDTFIGVDMNDDQVMDWAIKVVGVTNLNYGDLSI